MKQNTQHQLKELTKLLIGIEDPIIEALPGSGSDRKYFRIYTGKTTILGVYNADIAENRAYFSFTQSFISVGVNVPQVLSIANDEQHYLIQDLGNKTMFDLIKNKIVGSDNLDKLCIVKKVLCELPKIQVLATPKIDFSKCYPRAAFDRQSIDWDLNYFKYNFLKITEVDFDEQKLEDDFTTLKNYLLQAPANYFMHRDFQSRNILFIDDVPWFIDFQGGRKGPLQYDLASILFSPKTQLNSIQREIMLDFYIKELVKIEPVEKQIFIEQYYCFVLIRILQALGAYGYRGIIQGKSNFVESIPIAIQNCNALFAEKNIAITIPEIERIFGALSKSKWSESEIMTTNKLTVRISSFSYKKGIPRDPSGNGGGFVFDCRALPNPGRYADYKHQSGCDQQVIDYLSNYPEVTDFLENLKTVVIPSINTYIDRGFTHLCVNFGCTGGQHRSVYFANHFSTYLKNNFDVNVVLMHHEQNNWYKDE